MAIGRPGSSKYLRGRGNGSTDIAPPRVTLIPSDFIEHRQEPHADFRFIPPLFFEELHFFSYHDGNLDFVYTVYLSS